MNKKYRYIVMFLISAGFGFWYAHKNGAITTNSPRSKAKSVQQNQSASRVTPLPQSTKRQPAAQTSPELENLLGDIANAISPQAKIDSLVDSLRSQDQKPILYRDANPYTGDMIIVRTENPFPKTRYFHAQYMEDSEGNQVPQHISFEFQKGESSMSQVISAIGNTFPNLGKPEVQRDSYVLWRVSDDRIMWVKTLDAADIHDDPFNSYSRDDVGTIRVAVEQEIHPHD